MTKLYYIAPSEDIFNEVKKASMELWHEVDDDNDKYGYATEKCDRIKDISNVGDNFMYMVAMFDNNNQVFLAQKLSDEARQAIRDRMIDGCNPEYLIAF
jgi:DNA-binding MltR family transcriptional regulator